MLFITVELLLAQREYPRRARGLAALVAFMAAYLVWLHVVHHYSGVWVYPVLQVLALPARIVFFAVCLAIGVGLYVVGERLNGWRWGTAATRAAATKAGGKAN